MKILSLECPYCCAPLSVSSELKRIKCEYCGQTVLIENELENSYESGYEFERGRRDANNVSASELAEMVRELIEPWDNYGRLIAEEKRLKKEIKTYQKQEKEEASKSSEGNLVPYFVAGAMFLGMGLIAIGYTSWHILLWALIISIVFLIALLPRRTDNSQVFLSKLDRYDSVCQELDEIESKYNFDIVPQDYRYEEAMIFIYKALRNQRAYSIQDAINLYEEYLYREEMKTLQREQIELEKKQGSQQKRELDEQLIFQQRDVEKKKSGITADGVITAGSIVVAGIKIAREIKKNL